MKCHLLSVHCRRWEKRGGLGWNLVLLQREKEKEEGKKEREEEEGWLRLRCYQQSLPTLQCTAGGGKRGGMREVSHFRGGKSGGRKGGV